MRIKRANKDDVIEWILLYVFFIMHGTNIISFVDMRIALPFTLIVIILFVLYKCKISLEMMILLAVLLVNYIISGLLSGGGISEGLNLTGYLEIVTVLFGTILLYKIDIDGITKFLKIVYVFSLISLICFMLVSIGAGAILKNVFLKYKSGMGDVAGKYFYVYNLGKPDRNASVFTEPGIFQGILVMCLFILLFMRDRVSLSDNNIIKYIIVFLVALVTTRSAAGYLGLSALLVGILLQKKRKQNIMAAAIIIVGIVYLVYDYYTHGKNSLLEQYFFGKFTEIDSDSLTHSSGGARLVAMKMGWEAATNHLFGIGYLNWEKQLLQLYGRKFGTGNALFTQLGTRGFIAFFITLYLAIKPAWVRKKGLLEFCLFCFLFIYIAIVQAKILYPTIVMVAFLPSPISTNQTLRNTEL